MDSSSSSSSSSSLTLVSAGGHPSVSATLHRRDTTTKTHHTPHVRYTGITALVFGREESGLTEEELRLCSHACSIPTGRMQASMNLSHAVAVVLGACFERRLALLGYTDNPGLELKGERT
jgi:tRNA C32,U32 (ribose-2'-O)-methylase TrmJ